MIYHPPPLPTLPPSPESTTKLTEVNLFQLIKFMVTRRCTPRLEDTAWITWYGQGRWHFYSSLRNLQDCWCSINCQTRNKAAPAHCICTLIYHDHLHNYIPLHSKLIQMAVVVHVHCGCYSLDIIKLLIHCITLLQETLCQYTSEGKKTLSVGLQDNTGLFPVLVFWLLIILSLFKIQLKNADYFSQYVTEDFNGYIKRKREIHCHGNHIEMQAMCEMYNRTIEVYQYSTGKNNSKLTVLMGSCVYWKQCKNLSHNLWHAGWKYFSLLVVWNSP